jgi:long-chain acyl-CoA synthetase
MKHDLVPKVTNEEGTFRFISIYAKNREEWVVSDIGSIFAGVTTVTLYDTLGADSIDYILNQTSIRTVVCSADKIKGLIDIKAAGKLPLLSHIIYFDDAK